MLTVTLANGGVLTLQSTADPVDLTPTEADQIKEFVQRMRAVAHVTEHTTAVTLNSGTLRATFDGNPLKLDAEGRELFSAVSDLLAAYRRKQEDARVVESWTPEEATPAEAPQ